MTEVRGSVQVRAALEQAARYRYTVRVLYRASGEARAEWRTRQVERFAPPYFFAATAKRRGIRYRLDRVVAVDAPVAVATASPAAPPTTKPAAKPTRSYAGWGWAAIIVAVCVFAWWPSADEGPPSYASSSASRTAFTSAPSTSSAFGAVQRTPTPTPTPVSLSVGAVSPVARATAAVVSLPPCASSDCNCADFTSREQLMLVFNGTPGDPHRLDGDHDGIPCEDGVGTQAAPRATTAPGQFIPYAGNGGGPTRCRDGTYSHSSGRGTCSHHGGIAR